MIRLRWGACPPEVRTAVRPLLLEYLWLVPEWVQVLGIYFAQTDEFAEGASCDANPAYQWAALTIRPRWLESNQDERRQDVVHEILHIPVSNMVIEHTETVKLLFADGDAPKFRTKLEDVWRREFERSVQSLTFSIMKIPREMLPATPFVEQEDEAGV